MLFLDLLISVSSDFVLSGEPNQTGRERVAKQEAKEGARKEKEENRGRGGRRAGQGEGDEAIFNFWIIIITVL